MVIINYMNIISWNVNGLRAVIKKDFAGFLRNYQPDVLGLQEIKIDENAIREAQFDFPDYQEFYNPALRKGYAGTAFLAKDGLKASVLPNFSWDNEGRVQILDLGRFYAANVYFPNANHELGRLDFKIEFNDRLLKELRQLEKTKPVLAMGDFNVAHQEIDLARPRENEGSPGFHPRERAWMGKFLNSGFIDTFRTLHPDEIRYSWWSYRGGARSRNVGWRIDYVCVSEKLKPQVSQAFILDEVAGSDHCPVGVFIDFLG